MDIGLYTAAGFSVIGLIALFATLCYDTIQFFKAADRLPKNENGAEINYLKVLGVEEVKPFLPVADPFTRPELTPAEELEGWVVRDIGGAWVKVLNDTKV